MAGRIPKPFIDDLLAKTDIVSVIESFIQLKKAGSNYVALCPFHNEKSPSFTISPAKQFYHCFGCGENGNAISFLMNYERMDFVTAVETLASIAGVQIPYESSDFKQEKSEKTELYSIMEMASHFYQTQLKKHSAANRAVTYLKQRGLSGEIAKKFGMGYAPPGWDNLLKAIGTDKKQLLLSCGLLIQKDNTSFYDRFRDRIMFPIRDRKGKIIAFGGRVIGDDTPKYLNSPETPIFHKGNELYGLYEMYREKTQIKCVLVSEGYMDVVALAQHGINYAVATLGTATTPNHIQNLFRITPEIVFCFDGDQAGKKAAWHALEVLLPLLKDGWLPKFMFLPDGEDPDSLVRKEGKENFENRINKALTLSEFFFQHLQSLVDMKKLDGRVRMASFAMPYIQKISANITREMFLENLSKQIAIDSSKIDKYLEKNEPKKMKNNNSNHSIKTKIIKSSPIRMAIMHLIQNPKLIKHIESDLPKLDIRGLNLLSQLIHLIKNNPKISTGAIIENFRDQPEYSHLSKLASFENLLSEQDSISEFCDTISKIQLLSLDAQIDTLMNKAAIDGLCDAEKKQLQNLLKEKQNL